MSMASTFGGLWDPWEIVDPFDIMRRMWSEEYPAGSEFEPRQGGQRIGGPESTALATTGGAGGVVPQGLSRRQQQPRRNPIRMDLIESPESVTVIAEMPGFNKEDIRVHVDENNILEISAERREERTPQPGETIPHRELHYGWYKRMFRLPTYANPEDVATEFKNGMLGIKFGRRAVPGHRQIAIQ